MIRSNMILLCLDQGLIHNISGLLPISQVTCIPKPGNDIRFSSQLFIFGGNPDGGIRIFNADIFETCTGSDYSNNVNFFRGAIFG